ncbi:Transcription initiation factor TFIID subunit 10 [Thelohanellus kitauei]|uniref:Transcription initiation factor TFIID subunit 10 n=1 Tax=Thelohanellus kitauei TaxID=669202 RepID=A0A0C2N5G8_THEKT|nr:Transcription initiation factor TFIID subunit 10 [Thelohanellus kitauei]KII69127.1 Transcription initiation factor TFIID subunit 10 [Thelohanellus kitauei]
MPPKHQSSENNGESGKEIEKYLKKVSRHECVIPNELTSVILQSAGVNCEDENLVKIISLGAQKFITEILAECYEFNKNKDTGKAQRKEGQSANMTLTYEDLEFILRQKGIDVSHMPYFS